MEKNEKSLPSTKFKDFANKPNLKETMYTTFENNSQELKKTEQPFSSSKFKDFLTKRQAQKDSRNELDLFKRENSGPEKK